MSEATIVEQLAALAVGETSADRDAVLALCGAIAAVADLADDPAGELTRAIAVLRELRDGRDGRDSAPIERIELALADVGAEHRPDPDWQSEVLRRAGIREDKS